MLMFPRPAATEQCDHSFGDVFLSDLLFCDVHLRSERAGNFVNHQLQAVNAAFQSPYFEMLKVM